MRTLTLVLAAILLAGCFSSESDTGPELAQRPRMRQQGGNENVPPAETIDVAGREREYYLHRPARSGESKLPLVLAFHGGEGHPLRLARQTGFDEVADRNGFVVAYPGAAPNQWNDGRSTTALFGDDVTFIARLIEHLVATKRIDAARIYAVGPSNGGMFTLRLACELSDRIAAFAVVAASFPDSYWKRCAPRRAVPMLLIHGSEDRFIRWQGGTIPHGRKRGVGGTVIPVPDTVAFWRERDGCEKEPAMERLPDRAPDDGTRVEVERYEGCRDGSALVLVRIEGGGHTWPGSTWPGSRRAGAAGGLAGRVSRDVDGTQLIWDFFSSYALPEAARVSQTTSDSQGNDDEQHA